MCKYNICGVCALSIVRCKTQQKTKEKECAHTFVSGLFKLNTEYNVRQYFIPHCLWGWDAKQHPWLSLDGPHSHEFAHVACTVWTNMVEDSCAVPSSLVPDAVLKFNPKESHQSSKIWGSIQLLLVVFQWAHSALYSVLSIFPLFNPKYKCLSIMCLYYRFLSWKLQTQPTRPRLCV